MPARPVRRAAASKNCVLPAPAGFARPGGARRTLRAPNKILLRPLITACPSLPYVPPCLRAFLHIAPRDICQAIFRYQRSSSGPPRMPRLPRVGRGRTSIGSDTSFCKNSFFCCARWLTSLRSRWQDGPTVRARWAGAGPPRPVARIPLLGSHPMSLTRSLTRALRGSFISAFHRRPSHPKLARAIRPIVDQLEKRVLLTALPAFVHMSGDASFTTSGSSGAMVIDLAAGSLTFDADLSSASGWNNATLQVRNAARVYFNSPQTLGGLALLDSAKLALSQGSRDAPSLGFRQVDFTNFFGAILRIGLGRYLGAHQ